MGGFWFIILFWEGSGGERDGSGSYILVWNGSGLNMARGGFWVIHSGVGEFWPEYSEGKGSGSYILVLQGFLLESSEERVRGHTFWCGRVLA